MFEKFFSTQKTPETEAQLPVQSKEEAEDIIKRVQEQVPNSDSLKEGDVFTEGESPNVHHIKSPEEVAADRDAAANPHGFTELKS